MVTMTLSAGVLVPTGVADAGCSERGFERSGGRCADDWRQAYNFTTYRDYQVDYLQQYIRQLERLLEQLRLLQNGSHSTRGDVTVTTKRATDIDDEMATLNAVIDFNDSDEATVFFRWGERTNNLNQETTRVVLDEDQGLEDFSATLNDLDDDTNYYFRAVAIDENGDYNYGAVLSFNTDNQGNDDDDSNNHPDVVTKDADDIDDSSAEISGRVVMNDFRNGFVFFVYGEDENQVQDVSDDFESFSDIDQDGDDLRKLAVDSDLDGAANYFADINGLDNDTEIFYAVCVAFENDDNDMTITCGDTESFMTDES